MEQLSGLDAAFVHQDSQRTPMHICAVLIYDTSGGRQQISRERLTDLARKQLGHIALFRRKLHRVVMGMDTPYWTDAHPSAWHRYISEIQLPAGSDWQSFQQRLQQIHSARMDLNRPLWEMVLINGLVDLPGLPPHCQALVIKIHHAAIDGMSMAAIIDSLHQRSPPAEQNAPAEVAPPSPWELWTRTHFNTIERQFKFAETVSNLVPGFLRARESRQNYSDLPPIHSGACSFNARVTAGRCTGAVLLPMSDVKLVKRQVRRVTQNDIAMACVSGALREYLQKHRRLPEGSLAAGVPINLRSADDNSKQGNKIATMIVGLATAEACPVERLRLIHRYAVAGKKAITALGTGTIMDISDSLAPGVLAEGIRTMAWASQVAELPVPFHTMISNVPGPATPLFLDQAELVTPMGLGPVRDNMGLFHIVSSSPTLMSLSFSACSRLMPDGTIYEDCLRRSWQALLASASQMAS